MGNIMGKGESKVDKKFIISWPNLKKKKTVEGSRKHEKWKKRGILGFNGLSEVGIRGYGEIG